MVINVTCTRRGCCIIKPLIYDLREMTCIKPWFYLVDLCHVIVFFSLHIKAFSHVNFILCDWVLFSCLEFQCGNWNGWYMARSNIEGQIVGKNRTTNHAFNHKNPIIIQWGIQFVSKWSQLGLSCGATTKMKNAYYYIWSTCQATRQPSYYVWFESSYELNLFYYWYLKAPIKRVTRVVRFHFRT